ncbi:MAG TPA: hypothetical protein VFC44_19590 [Candidatus Saccharimonadales bacterium]|nr:hypothetical protein [Candidatus Saccharimonadales bacterium]
MAAIASVEMVETPQTVEDRIVKNIRSALRQSAAVQDPVNLARLTEIAFRREFPVAKADNRLANAIARGISVRQKLIEAEGGSLSAFEAARELGISKAAILKRYHAGHLIAWREEKQNAARFPAWQFLDRKVLDGLEKVLKVLTLNSRLDDFGQMLFFLSTSSFLRGKRPLDYLRAGEINIVLQAAEGYGG